MGGVVLQTLRSRQRACCADTARGIRQDLNMGGEEKKTKLAGWVGLFTTNMNNILQQTSVAYLRYALLPCMPYNTCIFYLSGTRRRTFNRYVLIFHADLYNHGQSLLYINQYDGASI